MIRAALLCLVCASPAIAADWPQFLGPSRDGRSSETVKPWTGNLKPLWSLPIGPAHSSPVVSQRLVIAFFETKGKNLDTLAAYDIVTGEKKWEQSYVGKNSSPPSVTAPAERRSSTATVSTRSAVLAYSPAGISRPAR